MDPTMVFLSNATFVILFAILVINFIFVLAGFFRKYPAGPAQPISIVIPAYNEEKNIAGCLESALSASYPEAKEIIVVDDGSADRTREIVSGFRNVKIVLQNHMGKVDAINAGIRAAKNEIVVVMDADTVIKKNSLVEIAKHFSDGKMGAVSGVVTVLNRGWLGAFQNIEYISTGLIKEGFSKLFSSNFGLFGAFSAYRKSAVEKVGGFKKTTETEDIDMSLLMKKSGYNSITTTSAVGRTLAPEKMKGFLKQRSRWSKGILQTITTHKDLVVKNGPLSYIILVHYFWFVFSFLSIPILFYQFFYWLPYNFSTIFDAGFYAFRWFSLFGPFFTLYMMPEWGFSIFSFFAVLSGIVTALVLFIGLKKVNEKISLKTLICIFFYFPYTIILSIAMIIGAFRYFASGGRGDFKK
jgi:cellulose synthase/poly-beta-1,6-N-acetylglucosamine synthase-like glycosyltransferase